MSTTRTTEHGWVPTDASFGARLALVRQVMGWGNVKEAAMACGLPVQSWRNWERDGRRPRDFIEACERIVQRTGVSMIWLAGLENYPAGSELPRKDSNLQPFGYPSRAAA